MVIALNTNQVFIVAVNANQINLFQCCKKANSVHRSVAVECVEMIDARHKFIAIYFLFFSFFITFYLRQIYPHSNKSIWLWAPFHGVKLRNTEHIKFIILSRFYLVLVDITHNNSANACFTFPFRIHLGI